jgi:hypothetical protein
MTKRIYLSGPISDPDPVKQAANMLVFESYAITLRMQGHHVTNPAENGLPPSATWAEHMRVDIRDMMDCDTIYMLPGWSASRGACLERHIAAALGFEVMGAAS